MIFAELFPIRMIKMRVNTLVSGSRALSNYEPKDFRLLPMKACVNLVTYRLLPKRLKASPVAL